VLNIVNGGADIGRYLVSQPGVDKVAFTGSTAAGREIGRVCGELIRPVTLELGGKSAALVLDDADPEQTVAGLATASLLNTGQTCYMSTRILVPAERYDSYLDAITDMCVGLAIGDVLAVAAAAHRSVRRARWAAHRQRRSRLHVVQPMSDPMPRGDGTSPTS